MNEIDGVNEKAGLLDIFKRFNAKRGDALSKKDAEPASAEVSDKSKKKKKSKTKKKETENVKETVESMVHELSNIN